MSYGLLVCIVVGMIAATISTIVALLLLFTKRVKNKPWYIKVLIFLALFLSVTVIFVTFCYVFFFRVIYRG